MVLITSSTYVTPDLMAEFGKIPPAFLPLGNKRLYEYQIPLFKSLGDKIILSLPQSYQVQNAKNLQQENVKIAYVPDNFSLRESIIYCINLNLPLNETLHILHGDTLFEFLEFSKDNALSIGKAKDNYQWCYLFDDYQSTFTFATPIKKDRELIFTGYVSISHPYVFVQNLIKESSFLKALKEYSKSYPFEYIENNTWLDFGILTTYLTSRGYFFASRHFNSLSQTQGYICKNSQWKEKIGAEIFWFENLPQELELYIPRFHKQGMHSYKLEYLYCNTLAELFVFGKLPVYVWKNIFLQCKKFLSKLHSYSSQDSKIDFNYKSKTLARLKEFSKQTSISLTQNWEFNGIQTPSLLEIIESLEPYLQNFKFSLIHGDFCFSNIMYDFRSNNIKTFDPRGMDFSGHLTNMGDKDYDYAKLMHSCIGLYDYILAGFYDLDYSQNKINFSIKIESEIKGIQKTFLKVFGFRNIKAVRAKTIHLFLSMLSLHNDDTKKQMALLANAFRLSHNFKENK